MLAPGPFRRQIDQPVPQQTHCYRILSSIESINLRVNKRSYLWVNLKSQDFSPLGANSCDRIARFSARKRPTSGTINQDRHSERSEKSVMSQRNRRPIRTSVVFAASYGLIWIRRRAQNDSIQTRSMLLRIRRPPSGTLFRKLL